MLKLFWGIWECKKKERGKKKGKNEERKKKGGGEEKNEKVDLNLGPYPHAEHRNMFVCPKGNALNEEDFGPKWRAWRGRIKMKVAPSK